MNTNHAMQALVFAAAALALAVPACGSDDGTTVDPGVGGSGGGDAAVESGDGGPGGTEGGVGGGGSGGKAGSAGDGGPEAAAGAAGDASADVVDAAPEAEAGPPTPTYANGYAFTSGGGVGKSSSYKMWISTGASQPYGTGKTTKYVVSLGAPKPL